MSFQIDTTYQKNFKHPHGHGYNATPTRAPMSVVIHSTNGRKGSSFAGEAKFLRESPTVSAHYLVGKAGQIALILPEQMSAWHAGAAISPFGNARSIGIELHHAVGEDYPRAQMEALTWLVKDIITRLDIEEPAIDTHRAIALPTGRKVDPSDWNDEDFYRWRAELFVSPEPDWQREFGHVPFVPHFGFGQKYMEVYHGGRPLGRARGPERAEVEGYTTQVFDGGILLYEHGDGRVREYREVK